MTITTKLEPGQLVEGSSGRISQVFVNLLVNAAQAASSCSRRVHVHVEVSRRGDRIHASIRDTGPGIAPEHLARVFDAFFTTKSSANGTGLGLSITRGIVEDHGGTIVVESSLGEGTTFTIEVPATGVARADERPGSEARLRTAPARSGLEQVVV